MLKEEEWLYGIYIRESEGKCKRCKKYGDFQNFQNLKFKKTVKSGNNLDPLNDDKHQESKVS